VLVENRRPGFVIDLIDFFGQMFKLGGIKSLEKRHARQASRLIAQISQFWGH